MSSSRPCPAFSRGSSPPSPDRPLTVALSPPLPASSFLFPHSSNCHANSFRLEAISFFQKHNVTVHSYGRCLNNQPDTHKDDRLPHVKFSLAFENSEEVDYVTEKYFQALNFGAVPVVIGAPNILDYAPSENSIIHIENQSALPRVVAQMQALMADDHAYDAMLAWKARGPSDQFLALVDVGTVAPECRLCLYLADRVRRGEAFKDRAKAKEDGYRRPCACRPQEEGGEGGSNGVIHHLYVRERFTFEYRSLFLTEPFTVAKLHATLLALYGSEYRPVWTRKRPSYRKKSPDGSWDMAYVPIKIHKVYPAGITTKEALYGQIPDAFSVVGNRTMDQALRRWVKQNPCGEIEVTFV